MSHKEHTATLPSSATFEKVRRPFEDRFERKATDFRHALMRAQAHNASMDRPGIATHTLATDGGLVTMNSAIYVPGDIHESSERTRLLAVARDLGIEPDPNLPTHETRNRFLLTITNPHWASYPSVTYRPTDRAPVALTVVHVLGREEQTYRLVTAVAHNSSVLMHAEATMTDTPTSVYFPLYDGRRREFNPERITVDTAETLHAQYDQQSDAFLNSHNPTAPPRPKALSGFI